MNLHTNQRCSLCEHEADHACLMLRGELDRALALVTERAVRNGYKLPPAVVILDCPAYWRKGRSHG